jgi:transposase-like protein
VSTPGSYSLTKRKSRKEKERMKKLEKQREKYRKEKEKQKKRKPKAKGRPSLVVKKSSGRKDNYRSRYTPADMERAISMVQQEDYAVARAAEICGVPRVTLIDRLAGSHKGEVGRPNVLSVAEEKALVQVLVQMGQYNYPLTKRHLSEMVKNYLDKTRETRFIDNRPGRVWIKNFLERHKDQIAIKKANNIRR